jgi:hypothetical protein
VFWCTDPRLADAATVIISQYKVALGLSKVIPFQSPGIVGLYANEDVAMRPIFPEDLQRDVSESDIRRMALEASFGIHLSLHKPTSAMIVAHSECKGHPGSDADQEISVVIAARILENRLWRCTTFRGTIHAGMLTKCPDLGWKLKVL